MIEAEKEYKNLMMRLGGSLLVFLFTYYSLCGGWDIISSVILSISDGAVVYSVLKVVSGVTYVAAFTLPVVFFYVISKKSAQPINLRLDCAQGKEPRRTLAMTFAGLSAIMSMSYLNAIFSSGADITDATMSQMRLDERYGLVLAFVTIVLAPAFAEELLFRGMLISNLKPYGKGNAIVISAVLFGLMHQSFEQFLHATAAGVVLGWVYVKTESIWCGVIIHMFNNLFSVFQMRLLMLYGMEKSMLISAIMEVFVFAIGAISLAMLVNMDKSACKVEEKSFDVLGGNGMKLAFTSPTVMVFEAICVLEMISLGLFYL